MQYIRYVADGAPVWGVNTVDGIVPLTGLREEFAVANLADPAFADVVAAEVEAARERAVPIDEVRPLAPVPRPEKLVCIGRNYQEHADEQDEDTPDEPLLFAKAPTAVTNPGAPIVRPAEIDNLDYEAELAVVIGRGGKGIDESEARRHVAGYTAMNDVSGRDAQFGDEQWFRGKSYDTFAPMGPVVVPDHAIDPNSLAIECRVNGETKQSATTEQFIFDVETLVSYISERMTLRAGDVISTGTPGGVGIFRDPPDMLEPGDQVEVEIESIGVLHNHVVDA